MFASLCILGRQPALGLAELESLFGHGAVRAVGTFAALLDITPNQVPFAFLGGTIKFCKVLTVLETANWKNIQTFLENTAPVHASDLPKGKLRLGISLYGLNVPPKQIIATGLSLKKVIRGSGRSVRFVPNIEPALNSAQVIHNQLTNRLGWELIFVRDGKNTIVAQSIAVQDIASYALRDRGRPKRDARVGMLPPKLAQIIINLATDSVKNKLVSLSCEDAMQGKTEQRSKPYQEYGERAAEVLTPQRASSSVGVSGSARNQDTATRNVILDPFCGTGVILQEALLMGYGAYGTDLEDRMIAYTNANLDWLKSKNPNLYIQNHQEVCDATSHKWKHHFDVVATETYLGRPFSSTPSPEHLQSTIQDTNTIISKFLKNLAVQTRPGFRLCVAIPAWRVGNGFKRLPLLEHLEDLGYNRVKFVHASSNDLIYHREGQIVARELVVLIRKQVIRNQ